MTIQEAQLRVFAFIGRSVVLREERGETKG